MGFVVDKVALEQDFLLSFAFYPVRFIPPLFYFLMSSRDEQRTAQLKRDTVLFYHSSNNNRAVRKFI
jgi:hypothetical protein